MHHLGTKDGASLRKEDGLDEGSFEGTKLGSNDGFNDGNPLVSNDGFNDGNLLGILLGATLHFGYIKWIKIVNSS